MSITNAEIGTKRRTTYIPEEEPVRQPAVQPVKQPIREPVPAR